MAATPPTSTDCLAYWALEDLTDKTSNGNDLTNHGATSGATGILDDCYSLVTNDYFTQGDMDDFGDGDFAISIWVKFNDGSETANHFFNKRQNSGTCPGIIMYHETRTGNANEDKIVANIDLGSTYVSLHSDSTVSNGTWYHIVFTRDSTAVKLYINNSLEASDDSAGNDADVSNTNYLRLASNRSGANPLTGSIDEVSIYDAPLTANNVDYLYNSGSPGSAQQYPFSAATGTNFQLNIGDSWETASALKINIGDSWKVVASAKVNIGDSWKTIF